MTSQNGHNRPNLTDLEAQCQEVGCDPFCSRCTLDTHLFFTYYTCLGVELIFCRAGDACITYTVLNNDDERTVQIESKFCGQVELPNFPLKKVHIF